MFKNKKKYCPDCGGSQVNHRVAYFSAFLNSNIDTWAYQFANLVPEKAVDWLARLLMKILIFLGLAKVTYEPDEKDSGRAQVLWQEARARGIEMCEFHLFNVGTDLFSSNYKGDKRFFETLPRPKIYNPQGLSWMDNKNLMRKHFLKAGIKIAKGGVAFRPRKALKIFQSIDKPVIVKPNYGSRSRHTTVHLSDEKEFLLAFKKAKEISPWVMIEEELSGFVFRGTLIDKKLVAVIRREPAYIIGDGIHSIKELVLIENRNPKRDDKIFHKIKIDEDAKRELKIYNHTLDEIPKNNEVVRLGQKTSRAVGGGITDVSEIVHPDNKELLEKTAKVLNDPLIGVDFIMDDVTLSWRDQPRCGIIECNSAPFIDLHHFPLVGEPRNVAGKLWDIIYPESRIDQH